MTPRQIIDALDAEEILGLTLVGEARGEPIEGIIACGCVIRNRLQSHQGKYKSYREVCLEPFQFSCWNVSDSNYEFLVALGQKLLDGTNPTDIYIRQCFWVAHGIKDWAIVDNTGGRLYYTTTKTFNEKRPKWASNPKGTLIEYGHHTYFNV